MYGVLIAEDEEMIRNGLKRLLDWGSLDCELVGEAADGAQAIALLDEKTPDILICDICMPVLDGLAVLRHVQERGLATRVIFLTGYNEFSYARGALQGRAFDYLLKPLSAKVLQDSVTRAAASVARDRRFRQEYEEFQQILQNSMSTMRANFIRQSILYPAEEGGPIEERLQFFSLAYPVYQLVLIEIDDYEQIRGQNNEFDRQLVKYWIKKQIDEVVDRVYRGYILDYQPNSFLLLVGFERETQDLTRELQAAGRLVQEGQQVSLTFGVSSRFTDYREIGERFREAGQVLKAKFYLGGGGVLHPWDLSCPPRDEQRECRPLIPKLAQAVKGLDRERAQALAVELEECLRQNIHTGGMTIADARNLYFELFLRLDDELSPLGVGLGEQFADGEPYSRILGAESLREIGEYTGACVERLTGALEERRNTQHSAVIRRIREYLETHYMEDVTLDDVAELVHMNSSYISRIIKKATGKNYVEILLNIRIEAAKKLLRDPAAKSYRVAELVGINDSKYFSLLFKKTTGMTPTEYRNQAAEAAE